MIDKLGFALYEPNFGANIVVSYQILDIFEASLSSFNIETKRPGNSTLHYFFRTTSVGTLGILIIFCPEAVIRRCSVKKVFLKISQNSEENSCVAVSFLIKLKVEFANQELLVL